MNQTESEPPLPTTRIAGVRADACLAFANTLGWRGREAPTEGLVSLPDLIGWAGGNAGLEADAAERWLAWARQGSGQAKNQFEAAIALREAVYRMFSALASGNPIPGADRAALNRALADAPDRREVVPVAEGHAWRIPSRPFTIPGLLAPVLWSAADLLVQGDAGRIRQCANEQCLWLFVDQSKNGTRRWCDMAACGNRAKARRHYLKSKKA